MPYGKRDPGERLLDKIPERLEGVALGPEKWVGGGVKGLDSYGDVMKVPLENQLKMRRSVEENVKAQKEKLPSGTPKTRRTRRKNARKELLLSNRIEKAISSSEEGERRSCVKKFPTAEDMPKWDATEIYTRNGCKVGYPVEDFYGVKAIPQLSERWFREQWMHEKPVFMKR